jgi:hypothetical protein
VPRASLRSPEAVVRVETAPGDEAQVDFSHAARNRRQPHETASDDQFGRMRAAPISPE